MYYTSGKINKPDAFIGVKNFLDMDQSGFFGLGKIDLGDITGDLSSRRGRVVSTDAVSGGRMIISGQSPLAEMGDYQSRLKSVTGGEGSYSMEFVGYEPAPAAVTYNLVVDRFQTYFVGQDRLLCHDNSERRPTNALVPGLLKE